MADKKTNEENMETVELIDENGVSAEFEHLMTLEYEGKNYIVLYPLDPVEGVEADEVMIMRVESADNEDVYLPVENDQILGEVFEVFLEAYQSVEEGE